MDDALQGVEIQIKTSAKGITETVNKMVSDLTRLNKALGSIEGRLGSGKMNKTIDQMEYGAKKGSKSLLSLGKVANGLRFGALMYGVGRVARLIGLTSKELNSFMEVSNLYKVTMEDSYGKGMEFVKKMSDTLYLNETEVMRTQGTYIQMTKAMGLTSDKAYFMSEQLTKLTYDLSSLKDAPFEVTFNKLRAAIVGQTRPLREWGISVTEATLQETALSLGITRSIRNMSEKNKVQLRFIAIMRQSAFAMNDFEKTLMSPANLIRILQDQIQKAMREIGKIFNAMNTYILTYAIAMFKILGEVATAIATFFGYKEQDFGSGNGGFGDDITEGSEDASTSLGKLNKQLAKFDEMNVLNKPSAGGTSDILGDMFGDEIFSEGYKDLIKEVSDGAIKKAIEDIKELFGAFKDVNWKPLGDALKSLFETTKTTVGKIIGLFTGSDSKLKPVFEKILEETLPKILGVAEKVIENIGKIIQKLYDNIDVDMLLKILDALIFALDLMDKQLSPNGANDFFIQDEDAKMGATMKPKPWGKGGFRGDGAEKPTLEAWKNDWIEQYKTDVSNLSIWMGEKVADFGQGVIDWGIWLGEMANKSCDFVNQLWENLGQWVRDDIAELCRFADDIGKSIGKFFGGLKDWFYKSFKKAVDDSIAWISNMSTNFKNFFDNMGKSAGAFGNAFKDLAYKGLKGAVDFVCDIFKAMWNLVSGIFDKLMQDINDAMKGLGNFFGSVGSWFGGIFGGKKKMSIDTQMTGDYTMLARGGILPMTYIAGEDGKELVGAYRNKTTVMPLENTSFVDSMYRAVYDAVSNAQGGSGNITVQIGDEQVTPIVKRGMMREDYRYKY